MNSQNLHPNQHSAPDALFEQLERDLVALTTANLDEAEAVPAQVVDEFATEFLLRLSMPPDGMTGPPARE
jgi:hypothetical protein